VSKSIPREIERSCLKIQLFSLSGFPRKFFDNSQPATLSNSKESQKAERLFPNLD